MKSFFRNRKAVTDDSRESVLATTPVTVTATATTGTDIAAGTKYVNAKGVTGQAAYIIKLPALAAGERLFIRNISGFAFELESSASATIFINGNEADHSIEFADNVFAEVIGINATNVHVIFYTYPQGD